MSYRCALLGCGGRAKGHAAAYEFIDRGEIVAICDMDESRLHPFGDEFGVATRYTDLDEMLDKEKPHVVHCVTRPNLRVPLLTKLSQAGVPGVIVEKPIAVGGDDFKALRALDKGNETKIAVNHQLRHHPMILEMLQEVQDGKIGEVRFLDATALLPMAGQGCHVLDLMFAFNAYAKPTSVFGASSGFDDIDGTHASPLSAESLITFDNGARGALMTGQGAPIFEEGPRWAHKRIAVYGTHGFLHWRMYGWERSMPDGTVAKGEKDYREEDVQGQANHTNAMYDWLEDDAKPHPCNLGTSLDEYLVILAGFASAVEGKAIEMPFEPADDLLDQYKGMVGAS